MKEISNIIKTLKETIEFKKLQKAHEKLIIFLTPNSSTFYKEKIEERDKEIKEYKCVIKEFKKNNKILEKKYQEKIDTLKKVSSSEDQQTQKLLEQIKTLNNEINLNIKNWKISKNQEIILKKEKIKAFNLFLKKQSIMDSSKTEKMNLSKVFNEKLSIKIDNFAILILNEFMKTSDNFNKDIKMSNYTNWANLIQQWSEEFLDENTKNENYDITLKKEIDSVKLLVEFIKPLFKDLRIEDDKKFNEIINIVVNKNYSNKQKQHSLQKLKIKDKQEIENSTNSEITNDIKLSEEATLSTIPKTIMETNSVTSEQPKEEKSEEISKSCFCWKYLKNATNSIFKSKSNKIKTEELVNKKYLHKKNTNCKNQIKIEDKQEIENSTNSEITNDIKLSEEATLSTIPKTIMETNSVTSEQPKEEKSEEKSILLATSESLENIDEPKTSKTSSVTSEQPKERKTDLIITNFLKFISSENSNSKNKKNIVILNNNNKNSPKSEKKYVFKSNSFYWSILIALLLSDKNDEINFKTAIRRVLGNTIWNNEFEKNEKYKPIIKYTYIFEAYKSDPSKNCSIFKEEFFKNVILCFKRNIDNIIEKIAKDKCDFDDLKNIMIGLLGEKNVKKQIDITKYNNELDYGIRLEIIFSKLSINFNIHVEEDGTLIKCFKSEHAKGSLFLKYSRKERNFFC